MFESSIAHFVFWTDRTRVAHDQDALAVRPPVWFRSDLRTRDTLAYPESIVDLAAGWRQAIEAFAAACDIPPSR